MADAITDKDYPSLEGELGDLFLHLVFYSKMGSEQGLFDVTSVLNKICDKLVYRHPHIYGDVKADDEETVKANWEKLKLKEGKKSVLEGVPASLPALVKATRIQEKVKGIGFEFEKAEDVWAKVQEELSELKVEIDLKSEHIEAEFGDVLFSLVNYARFLAISPENALAKTNQKFIKRFQEMEQLLAQDGLLAQDQSLEKLDLYWERAKRSEQ
jgi:XTP/dITP diphosphohydrolase